MAGTLTQMAALAVIAIVVAGAIGGLIGLLVAYLRWPVVVGLILAPLTSLAVLILAAFAVVSIIPSVEI